MKDMGFFDKTIIGVKLYKNGKLVNVSTDKEEIRSALAAGYDVSPLTRCEGNFIAMADLGERFNKLRDAPPFFPPWYETK